MFVRVVDRIIDIDDIYINKISFRSGSPGHTAEVHDGRRGVRDHVWRDDSGARQTVYKVAFVTTTVAG